MKLEFETIQADPGSSFRLLHQRVYGSKYAWQLHYHPEYELVCVLNGKGTRHVGNHFSNYENGDLVLIGPNVPHTGFGLNAHGLHEEIVLQIHGSVIEGAITMRPEMNAIQALLEKAKYGIVFSGNIKNTISRELVILRKLPPFERYLKLLHVLQLMAISNEYELLNASLVMTTEHKKLHTRLSNVFAYVEQHFHEELDIRKIAEVACLSVPSFCNYFKKAMNSTFTDYLNRYRIQQACIMLQQDKRASETCFACGFNNVTYFNRVFKSIIKKTPSEFKEFMSA